MWGCDNESLTDSTYALMLVTFIANLLLISQKHKKKFKVYAISQ